MSTYFSLLICQHDGFAWVYVNGQPAGELRDGKFLPKAKVQDDGTLVPIKLESIPGYTGPQTFEDLTSYVGQVYMAMMGPIEPATSPTKRSKEAHENQSESPAS